MTKPFLAIALGSFVAAMIACGGAAPSKTLVGGPSPRDEIAQLDARISADLARLDEPRPAAPPGVCVASCEPRAMSGAAAGAVKEDPACPAPTTATCTESCNLKTSICDAAGRICTIASDLGGTDPYANEKCHSGSASCEAAKKRCCTCT